MWKKNKKMELKDMTFRLITNIFIQKHREWNKNVFRCILEKSNFSELQEMQSF